MALIKCSECGREVANGAECPFCVDYYAILGISPSATAEEIWQAYRRAAAKHHPDHGGTHAEMVRVNMAKDVLSDPNARREYDKARTQGVDAAARTAWEKRAADVRRQAEAYPRKWADFERWMHNLADDVRRAEYGSDPIGPFPTAGKSASGEAFICIGGLIGGILGIAVLSHAIAPLVNADAHLLEAVKVTPRASSWLGAFFLGALGGSWVGAKVHKFLQDVMGGHDPHTPTGKQEVTKQGEHVTGQDVFQWPSEAENVQHEALRCPTCGQTLRVPRLDREIVVTCPKCKNKFTREAKV